MSSPISFTDRPLVNGEVISKEVDREIVLVLPAKAEVKVLNEVGARIWALLDGQHTIQDIITTICDEYRVDPEIAWGDTVSFLEQLLDREMISILRPSISTNP